MRKRSLLVSYLESKTALPSPFPCLVAGCDLISFAVRFSNAYCYLANSQQAVKSSNATSLSLSVTDAPSSTKSFSYIIPYNQTQECDIYGPICQTGLMTAGVDLMSTTTTTILPCSSYLMAQSAYLSAFNYQPGAIFNFWPKDWQDNFGHSPECKSYAQVWQSGGQYTFSNCGSLNTIVQASSGIALPTQIPPGVLRQIPFQVYECCGNCSLNVPEVRLYYFLDHTAPQCDQNQTSDSKVNPSGKIISKRMQSIDTGSTTVVSGHTLYVRCFLNCKVSEVYLDHSTSPSVYLEIVGTAAVTDQCGPIGSTLTNPIITLPPNVLSTYEPQDYQIGSSYIDANGIIGGVFVGTVKPLKIADLQCPTFGIGIGTSVDGRVHTTVGPPWLPIIVPPPQAFSLDPTWESLCSGFLSYAPGLISFAIFDPPRALSPVSRLTAAPSTSPSATTPPNVPATPTAETDRPSTRSADVSDSLATSSTDPFDPPNSPVKQTTFSTGNVPASKDPQAPVNVPDTARPAGVPPDPVAKPTPASAPGGASPGSASPPSPSAVVQQEGDGPQSGSQGLGSLIFNALGKDDPQPNGNVDPVNTVPVPASGVHQVIIGGQILSISPSGVIFDGTLYSAGGPAISFPGGVVSLVSISATGKGSAHDDDFPTTEESFASSAQKTADPTLVSDPSGLVIAGSSLFPGGRPITVSGTVISLGPSSILAVGSSGVALPPLSVLATGAAMTVDGIVVSLAPSDVGTSTAKLPIAQTKSPEYSILDGMTVQSEPSAVVVDGVTLRPGGPGANIQGQSVSLEQGDTLDIGTSHFAMRPTGPVNGTSALPFFEGAQERSRRVSWGLLFTAISVTGLRVMTSR